MYTTYIETIKHNKHTVVKTYKYSELIYKTVGIGYTKKQSLSNHEKYLASIGHVCSGQNTIYIS